MPATRDRHGWRAQGPDRSGTRNPISLFAGSAACCEDLVANTRPSDGLRKTARSGRRGVRSQCARGKRIHDPLASTAIPTFWSTGAMCAHEPAHELGEFNWVRREAIRTLGYSDRPLSVIANGQARNARRRSFLLESACVSNDSICTEHQVYHQKIANRYQCDVATGFEALFDVPSACARMYGEYNRALAGNLLQTRHQCT